MRQRRNRTTTAAVLPRPEAMVENPVPALPARERKAERWHPKVVAWWTSVWRSPMAAEFLDSDVKGGLYLLAELYQQLWAGEAADVGRLAAEIRQQEVRFGLSPIDRRRLQWEIEKAEQADERTRSRRQRRQLEGKDPREILKVAT
ncbi:MAG TPA: hypothetical protein VNL18_15410 [Gemmatimonadales bacterium]|nr:hypothetical protein [Gemmatimonadales bacterium]